MIDNIPETLDEAVDLLLAQMSAEDKAWFRSDPNATAAVHHGPGTALRNDWGLWDKESPLACHLRAYGLWHGDDFSAVVFNAVRARLLGKPFDLRAEASYYEQFWRDSGLAFDGEPILGHTPCNKWVMVKRPDGKWERRRDDGA